MEQENPIEQEPRIRYMNLVTYGEVSRGDHFHSEFWRYLVYGEDAYPRINYNYSWQLAYDHYDYFPDVGPASVLPTAMANRISKIVLDASNDIADLHDMTNEEQYDTALDIEYDLIGEYVESLSPKIKYMYAKELCIEEFTSIVKLLIREYSHPGDMPQDMKERLMKLKQAVYEVPDSFK